MKRFLGLLSLAAGLALVVFTIASAEETKAAPEKKAAETAAKSVTVSGEIVDMACYMGHGAMGEKHKECALKCASNGMPLMMIVQGKAVLLTPDHDNPDPYNSLKTMAGSMVEVSGTLATRSGVSGINVTGAKLMAADAK